MPSGEKVRKVLLIILDGWGCKKSNYGNAIKKAHTQNFTKFWNENQHCELNASGKYVGLLKGNMGNSEVGHLHIGAGRPVKQDVKRIFDSIHDKSFFKNKVLIEAMQKAKQPPQSLHLLGLLSDANVHSNINHLFALLKMAYEQKVPQVYIHAFLDGRDVVQKSALKYIKMTERELKKYNKNWKIATITGRYYAMDRDNRWHREHKAYEVMVNCKGYHYNSVEQALIEAYKRGETDEFVKPSLVAGRLCSVKPKDAVIFFNFRSDRAREITRAFIQGKFKEFHRKKNPPLIFVCMTQSDPAIHAKVAFPPIQLDNTLGEVVSKHKIKQFRLAETEKWAHVTYFFNGLTGKIFDGEDRLLVPSPKVTTYDKQPRMSAHKLTQEAIKKINSKKYGLIVVNYANADMVGHTGSFEATKKAVQALDNCLGQIVKSATQKEFDVIITADHGNAEQMLYQDGTKCTAHTTNKVPFILIADNARIKKGNYALYNIAPTVLELLDIQKPKEMAESLLKR